MSQQKQSVTVRIAGEEYAIRAEATADYTKSCARYVDDRIAEIRRRSGLVETHKAAILAALAITDELFQARRGDRDVADRLTAMADDLARLLPPAKRGTRAAS
jgi:cell division protein ZapA